MSIQWLRGNQPVRYEATDQEKCIGPDSMRKATDLNEHNGPSSWEEMEVHGKIHHGDASVRNAFSDINDPIIAYYVGGTDSDPGSAADIGAGAGDGGGSGGGDGGGGGD